MLRGAGQEPAPSVELAVLLAPLVELEPVPDPAPVVEPLLGHGEAEKKPVVSADPE